jgi:hypothetical protein
MGIHKITSQVIDYAERAADMADAAQGKHHRRTSGSGWLLLPASGAAVYALLRSERFSRQAKGVIQDAKTRATELPEDLLTLVRETVNGDGASSRAEGQASRQTSSARKPASGRKTTARKRTARKTASASR